MHWMQIDTMPGYAATFHSGNMRLSFALRTTQGVQYRDWSWWEDGIEQPLGSMHSLVNHESIEDQVERAVGRIFDSV